MVRLEVFSTYFNINITDCTHEERDAIKRIVDDILYVKNPLVHDAELMTRIKGWKVPNYLPRLLLMAEPVANGIRLGYYRIPLGFIIKIKEQIVARKLKNQIIIGEAGAIHMLSAKILEKDYVPDSRLRDYQNEAVSKLVQYKRAQAVSMTGSGKTIIMSSVIRHFNMPAVILCHRKLLINQWKEAIKFILNQTPYTLVGGKVTKGDCQILIASFQSIGAFSDKSEKAILSKRYTDNVFTRSISTAVMPAISESVLKENKISELLAAGLSLSQHKDLLVIVDEAHVAPAFGFYNIVSSLRPTLLYGCTATPNRTDGRTMFAHAIFTDRTIETDVDEVKKHLTPLQYVTVNVSAMFDESVALLNSEKAVMDAEFAKILISDPRRFSQVVHAIRQTVLHGYTAVVICGNNLWLVEALSSAMENNNITYGVITGATKDDDRKAIVKGMENKTLKILLATTTIDVGVDITTLDAAIFPVPFSGETVSIQRAGRIVRKAPGKKKCLIIDFKDCLIPKAVGAYTRRKRHIVKTFGAISSDVILDGISGIQGLDPEWTNVIKLKENS